MLHDETDNGKDRDQADLNLMMSELEGLLQVTTHAFGVGWKDAQPGQTLDIFDETPDKVAEFQFELQQTVLEKLNLLENKLLQLKATRYQDSLRTPSGWASLFGSP